MTNATSNEYISLELSNEKSNYSNDVISLAKPEEAKDEFAIESKKIISLATMSMKSLANSYYKTATFLEASDIEQIKVSLSNYTYNNEKTTEFKNAIIADLTEFQNKIKANYIQKIVELTKEKDFAEKQVKVLEFSKNKLVRERLARVEWPYDSKTKEFDSKIAALQIRIQKNEQKIAEAQKMKPCATEKDILIYQMYLKDKYAV